MMNFQERSDKFQHDIEVIQKMYNIQLYASQVLLQNGELVNLIKMRDLLPPDIEKTYEGEPKTGDFANKKAQKITN